MKKFTAIFCATLMALVVSAEVPSADYVLAQAEAKASVEHKTIFLHFGASWCGWCKRLDAFLDRPGVKPVFEKYFIPVKMVVQEREGKKDLENPGAETLLQKLGGPDGLPFLAFLNTNGVLIANSKLNGKNVGFPSEPQEIDWFMRMIKEAAPGITEDDVQTIQAVLKNSKS